MGDSRPIARRELEKLGTTDTGVTVPQYVSASSARSNRRDPIGVIRDPAKNDVISFPLERDKVHFMDGFATQVRRSVLRFSPFAQDLCDIFAAYSADRLHRELPKLSRSQLLASAAAALALRPRPARAQALEKIRVAGVATDDTTPVYFAIRNGLYQKAGLDVEQVPTTSGTVATEAVLTGTYELGKGSPIAFFAHLRGLPITHRQLNVGTRAPISLMLVRRIHGKTALISSGSFFLNGAPRHHLALAWIDKTAATQRRSGGSRPDSAAGAPAEYRTAATMLRNRSSSAPETERFASWRRPIKQISLRLERRLFCQSTGPRSTQTIKKCALPTSRRLPMRIMLDRADDG